MYTVIFNVMGFSLMALVIVIGIAGCMFFGNIKTSFIERQYVKAARASLYFAAATFALPALVAGTAVLFQMADAAHSNAGHQYTINLWSLGLITVISTLCWATTLAAVVKAGLCWRCHMRDPRRLNKERLRSARDL